ncbi:MAG: hypothetical protein WAX38_04180 [Minisyncoccia bacterium]
MNMRFLKVRPCADCGEVRVIHPIEKLISYVEECFASQASGAGPLQVKPARTMKSLKFYKLLAKARIVTIHENGEKISDSRCLALFEGAEVAHITLLLVTFLGKPYTFFSCKYNEPNTYIQFSVLPSELLGSVCPIDADDKYQLSKLLCDNKIPAGASVSVRHESELAGCLEKLRFPLIAKPQIGTRGRHTVLHIQDSVALKRAFWIVKKISTRVVVQEELSGQVYRFTCVGGKFIGCALREYPYVTGDGESTIAELIKRENEHPLRNSKIFRHIPFTKAHEIFLEKHGLNKNFIPKAGERCIVGDKNSRLNGTITEDVTDLVNPTVIQEIERCAQVLRLPVVGLDALFIDVTQPYVPGHREGIIEANTLPYIDVHHFPFSGKKINVAAELWKYVYERLQ